MISIFERKTDVGFCHIATADGELVALEFEDIPSKEMYVEFRDKTLNRFKVHRRCWNFEYADAIRDAINNQKSCPIPIKLIGTDFQISVWRELQNIAKGQVRYYNEIADAIGKPGSARAVGNACSQNKVAYFIPCHRVVNISNMGKGSYRWGMDRKKLLLEREGVKI